MANALQAQEAVADEMKRREDPYKYTQRSFLKKFLSKRIPLQIDATTLLKTIPFIRIPLNNSFKQCLGF